MTANLQPLLRIPEVAAYLNCDPKTVYEYIHKRGLPALRPGGELRVDPDALRAWSLSRTAGPVAPCAEAPEPVESDDEVRRGPGAGMRGRRDG